MTDICHQLLDVYCLESTSTKSLKETAPTASDKNKNSLINKCASTSSSKEESFLSKQLKFSKQKSCPYKKETPKSFSNYDVKHSQNEYIFAEKTQNNLHTFALNRNPDLLDNKFWETLQSIKAIGRTPSQGSTNIIIQQNIISSSCNCNVSSSNLEHCVSNANTSLEYNFSGNICKPTELSNTSVCNYGLNSQPSSFIYKTFERSAEVVAMNTPHNQKPLFTSNADGTFSQMLPEFPFTKVKSHMIQGRQSTIGHNLSQYANRLSPVIQQGYPHLYPYNKDMHQTGQLCSSDVSQSRFAFTAQFLSECSNLRTETIPLISKENSYLFTCETPVYRNTEPSHSVYSFLPNTGQQPFGSMVLKDETDFTPKNYYQIENRSESLPYEVSNLTRTFQPVEEVFDHVQNPYLRNIQNPSSDQVIYTNSFRNDVPHNSHCQNFLPNLDTSAYSSTADPEQSYVFKEHPQNCSFFSPTVANPQFFRKKSVPSKGLLPTPQPPMREFDFNFDGKPQMY